MADQNRLLVVELKPVQAGDGMQENAERGAFQMEKLAAVFADKVHLGLAAARACIFFSLTYLPPKVIQSLLKNEWVKKVNVSIS